MSTNAPTTRTLSSLFLPSREISGLGFQGTLGAVVATLIVLVALAISGCSGPSRAAPVDAARAREALRTALDAWKRGDDPKSLPSSSTPMTVQDVDWEAGLKLVDYEVLGDGKELNANLSIQVKLVLSGPTSGKTRNKTTEKKVYYVVGTSPSVTVFRDMLRG